MLNSKSTKINKKNVKLFGTPSCKESTKQWADNPEECQEECPVECQGSQEECQTWAASRKEETKSQLMLMMLTDRRQE